MNVNIREELLHLLSVSATMAGLCIMGVTLFYTMASKSFAGTVADDILAICALLFLLCTYSVFWALRTRRQGFAGQLCKVADVLFALALTGMVVAGLLMVYERKPSHGPLQIILGGIAGGCTWQQGRFSHD